MRKREERAPNGLIYAGCFDIISPEQIRKSTELFMSKNLNWKVHGVKKLLHTRVFDVEERDSESVTGVRGDYVAIGAPEWVSVVAVDGDDFIMVRQYRHGYGKTTTEFPGGVSDKSGEEKAEAARRELLEETGYTAGRFICLGTYNPNPALFSNTVTFYLAEDLRQTGKLNLDEDELLEVVRVPIDELFEKLGTGEYIHAFLGTAAALYLREKGRIKK